jgi:hypothetical protein
MLEDNGEGGGSGIVVELAIVRGVFNENVSSLE